MIKNTLVLLPYTFQLVAEWNCRPACALAALIEQVQYR